MVRRADHPMIAEMLERRVLLSGQTFTVSTLADPGPGSLNEAFTEATAAGGGNTIDFANGLSGTIEFSAALTSNITIQGPGAGVITINAGGVGSVFSVPVGVTAAIEGLTITGGDGTLQSPIGPSYGGGIDNLGSLTVSNCIVNGNLAKSISPGAGFPVSGKGGGIYNSGTLTVVNSTVSGNTANSALLSDDQLAPSYGGGIFSSGMLTVVNSTIAGNNAADGGGGGVFNTLVGTATISNSTVSGNTGGTGGACGIVNNGKLTLYDSTVSENAPLFFSGIGNSGTLAITNCTISGNTGDGIGSSGTLTITDSTITNNGGFTSSDTGIYTGNSQFKLDGSIVADNGGTDIYAGTGANLSGSNDLIGDGSDGGVLTNSLHGTAANPLNPQLAPLGNYGGPTQTMAELAGSPAIGAGANFSVSTDQRGVSRPSTGVDIGAYQSGTLVVNTLTDPATSTTGTLSLREAISDANLIGGNNTIDFAPGLSGAINLASQLAALSSNITINGPGASLLTVNGGGFGSVFTIDSGITAEIEGLTVAGGGGTPASVSGSGGGIFNSGTLTIVNSTVSGNSVQKNGGGAYNDGALTLINSIVSGNSAQRSGGGVYNNASLTVTNSTISGNSSVDSGAGIESHGTLTLTNCAVSGNSCTVLEESAIGGGIDSHGMLTVASSTISNNFAFRGSGGIASNGTLAIINSTISGNVDVTESGGGIASEGILSVINCFITGNRAEFNGGGIVGSGTMNVDGSAITGNYGEYGGGISNNSGALTLTNSTLSGNTASKAVSRGGAIVNYGTLNISGSTISGNTASGGDCYGGGIANFATLNITDSTISGNVSAGRTIGVGGGIDNYAGPLVVTDSTISGNSALSGGGLLVNYFSTPSRSSTATLDGTLIAANSGADILVAAGATLSGSNDLIGDGSDGGVLTNSLRGTTANPLNPMLAPLGNYGGPTQTMAELAGSPAIGAGANFNNLSTDQRGFARPTTSGIDIGADQGALFPGDTNFDGTVNLTDLLTLLNNYGESGKNWTQGDFNFDGTVNLTDLLILLNNYGQSASDNSIAAPAATVLTYKTQTTPFAGEPISQSATGSPGGSGLPALEDADSQILQPGDSSLLG